MAEEKEETKKTDKAPDKKELKISKDASIDFPVAVVATEADPYHETGAKFHAGSKKAAELVKRGWVKLAMIALLIAASFGIQAQGYYGTFKNTTYGSATDTTTNTGTGSITTAKITGGGTTTTVVVTVTKISGTVAGTLTLLASNDGSTFKAITTPNTATALATYTATDGTATYHWVLSGSPYMYYRVTHLGTGTMASSLGATILKH
jgi:hypothetical protein